MCMPLHDGRALLSGAQVRPVSQPGPHPLAGMLSGSEALLYAIHHTLRMMEFGRADSQHSCSRWSAGQLPKHAGRIPTLGA